MPNNDAKIELVVETAGALKSIEQFSKDAQKVLKFKTTDNQVQLVQGQLKQALKEVGATQDTNNGKMLEYLGTIQKALDTAEQLQKVNSEVLSLRGQKGAAAKSAKKDPNAIIKNEAHPEGITAAERLAEVQEQYNAKIEESNRLNEQLDEEINKLPFDLDKVNTKAQKIDEVQQRQITKEDTLASLVAKTAEEQDKVTGATQQTADTEEKIKSSTEAAADATTKAIEEEHKLEEAARKVTEEKEKQQNNPVDKSASGLAEAGDEVEDISSKAASAKQIISEFGEAMKIAGMIGSKGLAVVTPIINAIKGGFNGLVKSVKNMAKMLKSSLSGLTSIIHKVRSSFNGMSGDMNHDFKHMITNITKYVLGFRSLFFLVRRLRKYIGEGIQNMAQFEGGNNHVNESITRLLSSLLYLKNAWATAFSPILQVVTPILEVLIDKIAAVGNAFSRFLGGLLGVKTVFQAVKVDAADYAKSLDKAAGGAGKAADKTKKLTDRLAAFDDLNVLGKDKDPDGTKSGGGGGSADDYTPDPNEMFKIVEVGTQALDKLKQMWADADFSSLGEQVTRKIVSALEHIDWGHIEHMAFKVGKSIITFLNGALGDDKLWVSVGKTIGEGINTISMFLYGILENNEVDFGGGIATLINNIFGTVDWQIVQANLVSFGEQLKENLISFFQTLNWEDIQSAFSGVASAIGQAFAGLINDPTLASELGITAGEIINLLITILTETFVNNPVDLGGAIATFLSNLFATIDWDTFNSDLEGFAGQLVDNFNSFFANLNLFGEGGMLGDISGAAESFTTAIVTIIEGIDFSAIINSAIGIGEALLTGIIDGLKSSDNPLLQSIGGLLETVMGAIETLLPLIQPLAELLNGAIGTFLEEATPLIQPLADLLLVIAESILPVISSAIENLLPYIADFVNLYLDTITSFITAMQPAFLEYAENILPQLAEYSETLFDVISSVVGVLISILDNTNGLSGTLVELLGVCLKPILAIVTPILKILVPILDVIGALLGPIVALIDPLLTILVACLDPLTMVFEFWGKLIETFVVPALTMCTAMIQATVVPILKVLVAMMEIVAGAFSVVSTAISALGEVFFSVFDGIGDYLKGVLNDMLANIESFVNGAISGLNSMISGLNSLSFEIPDWVPEYGGKELNLGLTKLSTISLPRLAQGAVIPPNREFMAVLGDQSHGTNIEAPLDTIKQAVAEVMGTNNGNQEVIQLLQQLITVVENKDLTIGDKEIGKANARYTNQQRMIRGTSF